MEAGNLVLNERQNETKKIDPLYVRVIRKKYKCILVWLFSIISLSQLLFIILDKFNNRFLESLFLDALRMSRNSSIFESPPQDVEFTESVLNKCDSLSIRC